MSNATVSKRTRKPASKPAQPAQPLYVVTPAGAKYVGKQTTRSGRSNSATWEALQAAVKANKGSATLSQLRAAAPQHKDFVAYAVRRGWLAPAS